MFPASCMQVGMICAGIFPDGIKEDWHRCIITAIRSKEEVEVC